MPKVAKEEKSTSGLLEESPMDILSNEPEVVSYQEQDIKGVIVTKTIEVSRMSVRSLETALQPLLKLLSMLDSTGNLQIAALGLLTIEDRSAVRDVISTCVNLTPNELADLPIRIFGRVMIAWLKINREEVAAFAQTFLGMKEEILKYKDTLEAALPQLTKESKSTQSGS